MPERLKPDRLAAASRQLSEETAEKLLKTLQRTGLTRPVYQIRNSQIASALLGTIGLALFIVGVEKVADDVPVLSNGYASILHRPDHSVDHRGGIAHAGQPHSYARTSER